MKVFSFVFMSLGFLVASFSAFAGGNIALHVNAKRLSFSNQAMNHVDYASMTLAGEIKLSDAPVENFNGGPETVSILYNPANREHSSFINNCKDLVLKNHEVRIDVFMNNVNLFSNKVEGGMDDVKFNTYVLKLDDNDFKRVTCEISLG
jgi:hypothetical protein